MDNSKKLVWNEWNQDHIKKHKVTVEEVEEAYKSKTVKSESYLKREMIFGETNKRRFLIIIISYAKQKNPYVVSARDMSKKERKIYDQKKLET